jgi:hypothetical protein
LFGAIFQQVQTPNIWFFLPGVFNLLAIVVEFYYRADKGKPWHTQKLIFAPLDCPSNT